jgi:hypothetical protein
MSSPTTWVCGEGCLLAHNLNNRLAIILGECDLIAEHVADPECSARLVVIRTTVKAMAQEVRRHECPIAGRLPEAQRNGNELFEPAIL